MGANDHDFCEKVVRLGLTGSEHINDFLETYQLLDSESMRIPSDLEEIVIIPSPLRFYRATNFTLADVDKLTVEMSKWYNLLQGAAQLSDHLKQSIKFQYSVRNSKKTWKNAAKITNSTTWDMNKLINRRFEVLCIALNAFLG
jgi:hypothetical protein